MNASKVIFGLLVCIGSIGFSWGLWNLSHSSHGERAREAADVSKSRKSATPSREASAPTEKTGNQEPVTGIIHDAATPLQRIKAANVSYARMRFQRVFQKLQLGESEREEIEAIVSENADLVRLLDTKWYGEARDSMRAHYIEDFCAILRTHLSERDVEVFRTDLKMREISREIDALGASLHVKGAQLTADQLDFLQGLLLANCQKQGAEIAEITSVDWSPVLKEAARILSPSQMGGLEAVAARVQLAKEFEKQTGRSIGTGVPGL